jgi:hypothetical protein
MKIRQDDVERLLRRAGRLPKAGVTIAGGWLEEDTAADPFSWGSPRPESHEWQGQLRSEGGLDCDPAAINVTTRHFLPSHLRLRREPPAAPTGRWGGSGKSRCRHWSRTTLTRVMDDSDSAGKSGKDVG